MLIVDIDMGAYGTELLTLWEDERLSQHLWEGLHDAADVVAALEACTGPGDAEYACGFVLDVYGPEFCIDDREATDDELRHVCEQIYFDSDTDFSIRRNDELYLIWELAHNDTY